MDTEYEVVPVPRGHVRTDTNRILEGWTLATASDPDPEPERGEGPVFNLILDGPERTLLWDTGSHPDCGDGHWPDPLYDAFEHYDAADHPLPEALDGAGYALADVDAVVQSHLHMDHAGGLRHFADTDTPVYVHREELAFAYLSANSDAGQDTYVAADFDRDLNWRVLRRDEATLYPGVEAIRLPGHTPGLLGLRVETPDGPLLVAGDAAYTRFNYEEEVPLGAGLLWDREAWLESVRAVKSRARATGATVVCGHDPDDLARLR